MLTPHEATEEEIAEMTEDTDAKMKKPHRRVFINKWKELQAARPSGLRSVHRARRGMARVCECERTEIRCERVQQMIRATNMQCEHGLVHSLLPSPTAAFVRPSKPAHRRERAGGGAVPARRLVTSPRAP